VPEFKNRWSFACPIINGWGDSLWKWQNIRLSRAHDLDLGSGHNAYRHASVIDLYLHTKFHWIRRIFLWTDGRTDVRTFETHFIRSTRRSRRTRVDVHNNQLRLWPEKRAYVLVYHQFFRCRVERQVWMTMGLLTDHSTLMGTWLLWVYKRPTTFSLWGRGRNILLFPREVLCHIPDAVSHYRGNARYSLTSYISLGITIKHIVVCKSLIKFQ